VRTLERLLRHHLIALGEHVVDREAAIGEGIEEAEEVDLAAL
jgi:hypothetical protein